MDHYLLKLERTVQSCWDMLSVCDYKGEQFTFGQMATNIEKLHIFFDGAGIKKGDKIALCAKNTARWAVSFFAINTYEAIVAPILYDFHPESINQLVDHCEAKILFADPELFEKLDVEKMPQLKCVISAKDFTLLYSREPEIKDVYDNLNSAFEKKYPMGFGRENVHYPINNDKDISIINYTSGTTSSPKGVMIRYECTSAMVEYGQTHMPVKPGETLVSMLPMAHMYGLTFELIYPLCSGVNIYFFGKTPSPSVLLKAMSEIRPYMVITVPLVMEKVYKSSIKPALNKLKGILWIPGLNNLIYRKVREKLQAAFGGQVRNFIMGGAALNPEVDKCFSRIKLNYMVGYGMTEAAPLLAYAGPDTYVPGSCGRPVDYSEVRIESEDPEHIAGEIQARGMNICSGYFKNEEASATAFTEDGWLRTGDLGIMDAQKNIFIRGRSKSMILSANGQNIYPEELEAIINQQPYVLESVVVDRSSKLVALVVLDQEAIKKAKLDAEAVSDIPETLRVTANRNLPAYSQITKVEVMSTPFEKTPKMSIKRFMYK